MVRFTSAIASRMAARSKQVLTARHRHTADRILSSWFVGQMSQVNSNDPLSRGLAQATVSGQMGFARITNVGQSGDS